jgi:hypothetical protein
MKAMKDGRASLMVETKDNRDRIRTQTGQSLAAAERFVAETGKANEKLAAQTRQMLAPVKRELRGQTHKMLASAHAGTKAQARKVMVETKAAVAGLKMETGRVLADAAGVMQRLCTSSRQRAAGWRDVLRTVRGNGRGARAGASVAGAVMERPARTKPKGKKKASAKKDSGDSSAKGGSQTP